jgi:hypothetical protein
VSDDDAALPDRLRQRPLEEGFVNRVVWIKLEVSLFGGHPRFRKLLPKWKDELLIASLQEHPVYCAEMAALFEGDDLALIVERVRSSGDVFAVKALAKSRPELAQEIQNELVRQAEERKYEHLPAPPLSERLDAGFFEMFLRDVPNTNPVPVQHWIATHAGDVGRLVDMTVRLPHRMSLFATITLLLLKARDPVGRHMARLCEGRPEAVPILERCLLEVGCMPTIFVQVCADVPGIDLDKMEEFILANWDRFNQRQFCQAVKRERGPMRDLLAVEHVMES